MNIEKWVCNKCGSPCKVEIHFDSKGPAGDVQRFRKRCVAGTIDIPEDHSPEWRRQNIMECVETQPLTAAEQRNVGEQCPIQQGTQETHGDAFVEFVDE